MPWRESDAVTERLKFIAAHESGLYGMTELCVRFGISRKTGYKLLARYRSDGAAGLEDRSHAPRHCPHRIGPEMEAVLLEARRTHPSWGPKKLVAYLAPRRPDLLLPAPSTVGALLDRHGLVVPRRRRVRRSPLVRPERSAAEAPNTVWSLDFKGEFRTGDGQLCYPLTVQDVCTRYLLGVTGLSSTAGAGVRSALEAHFREQGLPQIIRSDNGVPFVAPHALGSGLSRLRVWWTQLGIAHERIDPGRPDQNGRHERMHRTLKAETARPPEADSKAQQARFDAWRQEYNEERPHEALGQVPPASRYGASSRPYPEQLPEAEYPGHYEVRRVRRGGEILFRKRDVFVSETLAHENVALEEVEDGVWAIWFYDLQIGRLDERTFRLF
jgi:transposase InsO family protein